MMRVLVGPGPAPFVARLLATAPLRATEDAARIAAAMQRFIPGEAVVNEARVRVETHDLAPLRQRIWELRIIDAIRGRLLAGHEPGARTLRLVLSKQALMGGHVAVPAGPHPLGDVELEFTLEEGDRWPDAEALAWWLCPETRDGEIVGPKD
jgi:predicted RNA binding protein with dsRBD fold (UPF0201 family)